MIEIKRYKPKEGGVISFSLSDLHDETPEQTPIPVEAIVAVTWTLKDGNREIVNEREDVTVTPAEEMLIVVHGDDLLIDGTGASGRIRYLIVNIEYHSDSVMDDTLHLIEQIEFEIEDVK